jgi:hypothetical protein
MELTRRDAVAALAAVGATGAAVLAGEQAVDRASGGAGGARGGETTDESTAGGDDRADSERVQATMEAVAAVVYPDELTGVDTFLERYLDGRLDGSDHALALRQTVAELEELAEAWYGNSVAALPAADRDALLREVGADTAEEDPDGTTAERVRYYVVNDLLLALYASPTGGELVGLENPRGHPGGITSYARGPQ